nr:MAG TPA: hypothetical protein [Caudoviricetes sp.]
MLFLIVICYSRFFNKSGRNKPAIFILCSF